MGFFAPRRSNSGSTSRKDALGDLHELRRGNACFFVRRSLAGLMFFSLLTNKPFQRPCLKGSRRDSRQLICQRARTTEESRARHLCRWKFYLLKKEKLVGLERNQKKSLDEEKWKKSTCSPAAELVFSMIRAEMMPGTLSDLHLDRIGHSKLASSTAHADLLGWLETIPLSRPVRHLESDFADGVLIGEIVAYYFPEFVDFDLFRPARNMSQRAKNWRRLNSDVLPKLSLTAPGTLVHHITNGDQRSVELFLLHLREKIEEHLLRTGRKSRLQWETWRSFHHERSRLPRLLIPAPLTRRLPPGYAHERHAFHPSARLGDSYPFFYDEQCRVREEEMELIRTKLKRYEQLLRTKEQRILQLEEQLDRMKLKNSSRTHFH